MILTRTFIFFLGLILGGAFPVWASFHLENIELAKDQEAQVLFFKFEKEVPEYQLILLEKDQGFKIRFKDTRLVSTEWLKKFRSPEIEKVDVSAEDQDLLIEVQTKRPVLIKEKKEGAFLILTFQAYEKRAPSGKEVTKSWYKRVELPSLEGEIEVPLTKEEYTGTPISVDFQNADIHAVLRLLASIGGFNIVVSDTVRGTVTLKLDNVPWDQVLDIVLSTKGLGMIKTGSVIRVAPLEELYQQARRVADIMREQAREEEQAPLETVYLQINYAKAKTIAKQIEKILSPRGEVTYEERTNQVILKDVPKVIKEARVLVSQLDQPTKQVFIEAKIIEIRKNYEKRLGIRWQGAGWRMTQHTFTGLTPESQFTIEEGEGTEPGTIKINIDPGAIVDLGVPYNSRLGFTFGRVTKNSVLLLDIQLSALEKEGVARVISAPRIITEDHQEAEIKQGFKIPYLRQTQDGISTEFIDAALKLKVTPHVTPDNRINLEIEIEKNAPDFGQQVRGVPSIVTRYAKTRVFVTNGETIVIGGIIEKNLSNSSDKVPGLSSLPGVGGLFKNRNRLEDQTELMVFITPRIVAVNLKEVP